MTRQEFLYYTLEWASTGSLPESIATACRLYFDIHVTTDPLLSVFNHRNYLVFKDEILHFLTLNNPDQYVYLDEATKRLLTSDCGRLLKWPDLISNSGQAIEMKTVYEPPKAAERIAAVVRDIAISGVYTDTLVHVIDASSTQNAAEQLKIALDGLNIKYTVADHSITKPIVKDTFEVMSSKLSEVTKAHAPFVHPRGSGIDIHAKADYIAQLSNKPGLLRGLVLRVLH